MKNAKNKNLEYMVYRCQLTYDETLEILDLKLIPSKRTIYSLNPSIHEVVDLNNTLKYFLPDNVKLSVTFEDIKLKSNIKSNQSLIFTKKYFFYTI